MGVLLVVGLVLAGITGLSPMVAFGKDHVKRLREAYQTESKTHNQWSSLSPALEGQVRQSVSPAPQDISQNLQHLLSTQPLTARIAFTEEAPPGRWWLDIGDPHLTDYIERALVNNPDAETVRLRIRQLHATVRQTRSGLWPKLDAYLLGNHSWNIAGDSNQPGTTSTTEFEFVTPDTNVTQLQAPFILSFEPDIWGTTWLKTRAQKREMKAAEYDAQQRFQTIAGQVAVTYLSLMEADALVQQQAQDVFLQQRLLTTEQARLDIGVSTADVVARQQETLTKSQAALIQYRQQQYLALFSLAAWVGQPPNKPESWPRNALVSWPLWTEVAVGAPALTLMDHPNVKAREAELEKAMIDVSVARRAFLPVASFNGGFVFSKFKLGDVLDSRNILTTLVGSIAQPLFDAGYRRAGLSITKREAEMALQGYYKALISTAKNINEAIVSLQSSREALVQKQEGLSALQKQLAVRQAQAQAGSIALYSLYPIESQAVTGMQGWIQTRRQVLSNQIQLASALGSKL